MTQVWRSDPSFKITIGGNDYIDDKALTVQVVLRENNISSISFTVDDYKSSSYVGIFDALTAIDISLRYGSASWNQVFGGIISSVAPQLSMQGELLQVGAWGDGNALVKTHCDESYGVESVDNHTVDTPKEIIEDIIDEHVNKIFGAAAASNWSIGKAVDNAHAGLSVTFLNSQYHNNFVNVNRVCDLANAYAQGLGPPEVSTHWFVDTTPNFMFKKIDADHTGGDWDHYWGGTEGVDPGTQASSTITVTRDMILYDFRKHIEEYANHIVLSSKFRMPAEDYWTEDSGGAALWGSNNITVTDNVTSIVGSHSIHLHPDGGANASAWYPSGKNASWDLTRCGSPHTVPTLGLYVQKNSNIGIAGMSIYSGVGNKVDVWYTFETLMNNVNNKWVYLEFPVGPYFDLESNERSQLAETGNMDWTDVDWIQIDMASDVTDQLYIDDLHFSGVIVREAKDAAEIAANKTYQKVIRNDTAVSDTLVASDDSGTAARLAYAELLRRSQTPIVGMVQIPLAPTILPGQTVHMHACLKQGYSITDANAFRIDKDMRVKEVRHLIGKSAKYGGFETRLNLTDDVTNSHAFGAPSFYSLLKQYAGALGHSEARDLKGGALDNLIPRLTVSY